MSARELATADSVPERSIAGQGLGEAFARQALIHEQRKKVRRRFSTPLQQSLQIV
jgi:hypothetical protein